MKGDSYIKRGQVKGYLFEIVILALLDRNGFKKIDVLHEPRERFREERPGFIEMKGRGCWHQIDCPCDYHRLIPFSYPLRLLGEVKFYSTELSKKAIREFIGVVKDIQENYFVFDGQGLEESYPRKTEIAVYFAANGFQEEAEKLAYAHGIKTVSYKNNYIVKRIKELISELEKNYIRADGIQDNRWPEFYQEYTRYIYNGGDDEYATNYSFVANGYQRLLNQISEELISIRTNFVATTATGVFIHFFSKDRFPEELFYHTDNGYCRVYYHTDRYGNKSFWMTIRDDEEERRFYFSPPDSLSEAAVYGREIVLGEKEQIFKRLSINIEIRNVARNLILEFDNDWKTAVLSQLY